MIWKQINEPSLTDYCHILFQLSCLPAAMARMGLSSIFVHQKPITSLSQLIHSLLCIFTGSPHKDLQKVLFKQSGSSTSSVLIQRYFFFLKFKDVLNLRNKKWKNLVIGHVRGIKMEITKL